MNNEDKFSELIESLDSIKPVAKMHALELLYEISPSRAIPVLIKNIGDKSSKVRAKAVSLLGKSKDPLALKALLDLEEDRDWKVKASVKKSLEKMKNRKGLKDLKKSK